MLIKLGFALFQLLPLERIVAKVLTGGCVCDFPLPTPDVLVHARPSDNRYIPACALRPIGVKIPYNQGGSPCPS
jgi:hypothetical protein